MNGLILFGKWAVIQILSLSPYLSPKRFGPTYSEGVTNLMALGKWGVILCLCECKTFCWLLCPDWFLCWVAGLVLYLDHCIMSTQMCWVGPVELWKFAWVPNAEDYGLGHFSLTPRLIFCSLSVQDPPGNFSEAHGTSRSPSWLGNYGCPAQCCLPILCHLRCVVWQNVGLFLVLQLSSSYVQGNGPLGTVFFKTHLKTLALCLQVSSYKLVSSQASMTHLLTHLSPSHIPRVRRSGIPLSPCGRDFSDFISPFHSLW